MNEFNIEHKFRYECTFLQVYKEHDRHVIHISDDSTASFTLNKKELQELRDYLSEALASTEEK